MYRYGVYDCFGAGPARVCAFHVLDVGPVIHVPADTARAGEGAAAWFRAIAEQSSDLLMIVDAERTVSWANKAFERVLGYPPESLVGTDILPLTHPSDLPALLATIGPLMERPGATGSVDYRMRAADGAWHCFESTATNLFDEPDIAGIVVSLRDVTEQRQAEKTLQASEQRYRDLFEHASDAIMTTDISGRVTSANTACERMFGYSRQELVGSNHFELIAPEDLERAQEAFARQEEDVELYVIAKDGSRLFVEANGRYVLDADGKPTGLEAILRDRTEHQRLQDQLTYQAFHDALTQLPNRLLFLDRLDQALARASRDHSRPVVMMLDLDGFKAVNDTHGHETGDELLRSLARILQAALRPSDTVARFGGDEFAILAEGIDTDDALEALAERIMDALDTPIPLPHGPQQVSGSLGIATATPDSTVDQLLHHADTAMYRAKQHGPGFYEILDPEPLIP